MKRNELEHIIRASGAITGSKEIFVIGSQAILGSYAEPPPELLISMEADVWPADNPSKADLIDGCIGELSPFHETFGYYAHGVGPETAKLPNRWGNRVVFFQNPNTNGYVGLCLHPVDIVISKLFAAREKDFVYINTLIKNNMVDNGILAEVINNEFKSSEKESLMTRLRMLFDI